MVDYDILERFGTTREMIRAVFTSKSDKLTPHAQKIFDRRKEIMLSQKGEPDAKLTPKEEKALKWRTVNSLHKTRKAWEKRICTRLEEARCRNFRDFRFYYAADMAWDSSPIHAESVPLNLYAQGKIDFEQCVDRLRSCCGDDKDKFEDFIMRDGEAGNVTGISIPRLHNVAINIVRPLVTRRLSAQANKYNNLYPFFKYEPRDRKPVSKLRGDVMSQRAEIMSDNYGYRHMQTQATRKMLLHGHALVFPESAWDKQYEFRKDKEMDDGSWNPESVLVKEGISPIIPHPSRTFYDLQYPMSSLNTDTGCSYVGYWDIDRLRNVKDNPHYFNTDEIRVSEQLIKHFDTVHEFNQCFFEKKQLALKPKRLVRQDAKNDRTATYWIDANNAGDTEVVVTTYYEKIIPKDEGLGDYPYPVWIRLLVLNDDTVIFGEIMPSKPCAYMGHNQDDSRMLGQSMAHEILPYQDQMSNFFSQMLYLMKLQSFLLLILDTDMIPEEHRKKFKELVSGNQYFASPMLLEQSNTDFRETFGKNPDNPVTFTTPQIQGQINELMRGITQILELAERNQIMSPQELGQFSQRETSATEVAEVTTTTNALFGFISEGIDEFRAAWKQLIYESTVAKGRKDMKVPVISTYPERIVTSAGFEIDRTDEVEVEVGAEEIQSEVMKNEMAISGEQALRQPNTMTVIGTAKALVHNYVFNSRDGAERSVNIEAGKSLVQLLQVVGSNPAIIQAMGEQQLFDMISEIFRLSGSPFIVEFDSAQKQAGQEVGPDGQPLPSLQEVVQAVTQIGQAVGANTQQLQTITGAVTQMLQALGVPPEAVLAPQGAGVGAAPPPAVGAAPPPQVPAATETIA